MPTIVEAARVRTALQPDMEAVSEIYSHYVRNSTSTFEIQDPGIAEMTRRWSDIATQGLPYLVADVDGSVAGYAYAGLYRPRRAYRFTVEDSVYIHPDHVRCGLGKLLLTRLIECCQAKDLRQMVAVIGDSSNAGSVRLHAQLGFRTIGTLEGVGLKFGRWIDTVIMQRSLAPPV